MPTPGAYPKMCFVVGLRMRFSILYEELIVHHLWCRLYTLVGGYFMNKEGCLTFGGRSLVDEVNHVHLSLFMLLPHDVLMPSLCIVSKCLVSFLLVMCLRHGWAERKVILWKIMIRLMFNYKLYDMHSKSLGHYNDDFLWITLQEILKWLFCFMHIYYNLKSLVKMA